MALAMMAKRFPRDVINACDRIRNAFTRQTLAGTELVACSNYRMRWYGLRG